MNVFSFFLNFLKDPHIGAILPSSRFVLKKVLDKIECEKIKTVVEYGPGSGTLTRFLLEKLRPEAKFIGIETNPKFYQELLKIQDSRLKVIHGNAKEVDHFLNQMEVKEVDLVLCSIPLSHLKEEERQALFEKTKALLSKSGKFIIYNQYSLQARRILENTFHQIHWELEIRNIPPAFMFEARKCGLEVGAPNHK
ncbi:MAG: methyltransferase domain-containing protein [Chlamydiae bacterium]|nr:methyltransferase domain-containing protein [Chlamydiota bacterium]MBI3266068.1 methyltransferase domain-containing protein [Chlamydiota bacterium]